MWLRRREDDGPGRWPSRLALTFVLLTLAALVVVPWLVQRRVNAQRAEIFASEPARTLVSEWQFDLVRELAMLAEVSMSGDSVPIAGYRDVVASEEALQLELTRIAAPLGPDVAELLSEARVLAARWHERIDEELDRRSATGGLRSLPRERELFSQVLTAIDALDGAILARTNAARARIMSAERTGLFVTVLLGGLALIAASAVVALNNGMRQFAEESERRREVAAAALTERARADEARIRLLRGITHDVKNPLGAARGYAELLGMGLKAPVHPDQIPLIEGIERSVDSALAIIADLLDLARAESREVAVRREEVDVSTLIGEAVADYEAAASTAGHVIEAEATEETVTVYTDAIRVQQILGNLLSNAIKYTPSPGRIVVRANAVTDAADAPGSGPWAVLSVSDTGPGIPEEAREVVFDEFSRLEEGSSTKGHGLGLSVARSLARRLGGDLTIADTTAGATLVLWIPKRQRSDPAQA